MNLKITLSIGVLLNTTLSVMSLNLTREQAKKRERERESWIEVVGCGRNLPSKHSTLRRRYGGGVNDIFVSQYIGQVTRQVWWCVCECALVYDDGRCYKRAEKITLAYEIFPSVLAQNTPPNPFTSPQ